MKRNWSGRAVKMGGPTRASSLRALGEAAADPETNLRAAVCQVSKRVDETREEVTSPSWGCGVQL